MKFLEFCNSVHSGQLEPVYFFSGEETGLIEEGVGLLLARLVTPEMRDFNFDVLYGSDVAASRVLDIATSYPMMASHRTLVVRDVNKMPPGDISAIAEYAKSPCSTTYLIVTQRDKSSRKKSLEALRKASVYVDCRPLYDNQVVPWIQNHVKKLGATIAPEAAQFLATEVGNSIHALRSELEKVLLYLDDGRAIALRHVQEVAGFRKDYSVYSLQNAIGEKNLKLALRIAEALVTSSSTSAIINSLAQYFGHLYLARALSRRQDLDKLSQVTGVHSFFATRLQQSARRFTTAEIFNALEVLRHADFVFKSQSISPDLLLRVMIIAILRNLPPRSLPFSGEAEKGLVFRGKRLTL